MPKYLAPGVYVDEIERGPTPIEGVPTGTAAFVGETERGPLEPRPVTSYNDYRRWFGGSFAPDRFLPHAVEGFFWNGGQRLYVCRIGGPGAVTATRAFGDCTVRAVGPGAWGNRVRVQLARRASGAVVPSGTMAVMERWDLRVAWWADVPSGFVPFDPFVDAVSLPRPALQEAFDGLVLDPHSPDHFTTRLEQTSALVRLEGGAGATPRVSPTVLVEGEGWLEHGADAASGVGLDDYVGEPTVARAQRQGLAALEHDSCRDVALVYAPYPPTKRVEVARAVIAHCESSRFRFAVIDGEPAVDDLASPALDPRTTIADSAYAAFYTPWLEVGAGVPVPPGGHVLGVYARTDRERGVFKAPANEIVRGALGPEFNVNDAQQDVLHPRGVNVIRQFPNRGIRLWGARTLSADPVWKYVNVRRLFNFLERSIVEGTQWVVFKPNDEHLWAKVSDAIRVFLRREWRNGALLGLTEDEAFFVHCDRTTMTQDDVQSGRLICEVGIAAVRPAEFVIWRLQQRTAEA